MGRRTAFADILEGKLGPEPASRPTLSDAYGYRATVHAFYEFAAADKPAAGWRARTPYGRPETAATPRPEPTATRARVLSPQERAALDQLNALGAHVGTDFTADELRHAFRSLALTFHPDRHPGKTRAEIAQLSQNFIALHDAYRALQTAAPLAA